MENINVEIPSSFNLEEYNQKQLAELKKSTYLSKYLADNNMTWDDVASNINLFKIMMSQIAGCKNCDGLNSCNKVHKGLIEVVRKNKICDITLVSCKHREESLKRQEFLQRYVYGKFSDKLLSVTLKTMQRFDDDLQYMNAWNQIVQYAPNVGEEKGIYLYGSPGVGKTYLLIALCNTLATSGKTVAFVNVPEFISDNKIQINKNDFELIKEADFVVFDDIGQESVTNVTRDEILFPLLNSRMTNNKATCFTSNLSFDDLFNHFVYSQYGDKEDIKALRILERIRALSREVEISGKSRR